MKLELLFEDEDLIIVNKPAGLLVIPDRFDQGLPSLNKLLEAQTNQKIWVVHRLDRDTSGAICFAKNEATHKYLSKLFQEHAVEKYYTCLVNGHVIKETDRIEEPIAEHPAKKGKMIVAKKGKESITEYEVIKRWPLYSYLQVRIYTGRTHQIRVHMQSIGHAVVCDELYGDGKPFMLSSIKKKYKLSNKYEQEKPILARLGLHASKLSFKKEDSTAISVEAPLPKDIAACVKQLDKWASN